jgi:glycosyltransferase involved in cell wall biosynthesis
MPSLSVIVITCNEEMNLGRMLDSVKFADEIIINDSGSTDHTIEIAREYHCKIMATVFAGFGAAKQAALDQATGDWVLSLDADEELDATLQKAISAAIADGNVDGYYLNRKSQFLGKWIMHSGWYPDYIVRLFRRDRGRFSSDKVHERIEVEGQIGRLKGHIFHYTDPDITHYLKKLNLYTSLSAQSLADAGRRFRFRYLIVKPLATFVKMYILKSGFRDGIHGLILALLSAFHTLCKYAKLWEFSRR